MSWKLELWPESPGRLRKWLQMFEQKNIKLQGPWVEEVEAQLRNTRPDLPTKRAFLTLDFDPEDQNLWEISVQFKHCTAQANPDKVQAIINDFAACDHKYSTELQFNIYTTESMYMEYPPGIYGVQEEVFIVGILNLKLVTDKPWMIIYPIDV